MDGNDGKPGTGDASAEVNPSAPAAAVLGGAAAQAAGSPAPPEPDAEAATDQAEHGAFGDTGARPLDARRAGPATARPAGDDGPSGRHFRASDPSEERRRKILIGIAAVPLVALLALIAAWAIDSTVLSGQVMRNVEVAGRSVGGIGEEALPEVMGKIADEVATRPVTIESDGKTYKTTAGDIGLAVDTDKTATAALDAGRDQWFPLRPFAWLGSFFSSREVPVSYSISESLITTTLLELQGDDVRAPADPSITLADGGFVLIPGTPGLGIDVDEVADALPKAAGQSASGPITIEAGQSEFSPRFSDEEAQALADHANQITAEGLAVKAGDRAEARVEPGQLRSWIGMSTDDGKLELVIDGDAVSLALPELFSELAAEPKSASITLEGGTPVVTPASEGVRCCGDDSAAKVFQALQADSTEVTLDVEIIEPKLTTEAAEKLGIKQPVGGNHAWRDGAATSAGPGFTTYHAAGGGRVTNIHRMADQVRGALVLPGETFSINEHIGPRTPEKGYVPAGAIRDGEHVDEVGGGVSQFATTLFNAAYFAGLDITSSQAHSEWFSRYPPGREATMGHPAPDLAFKNSTPYGILIWTSYTDTSLTVTLYSSPHATAEQTDMSESMSGNCRVVSTTRTRTFPDGRKENDTFRATYRPGEGEFC